MLDPGAVTLRSTDGAIDEPATTHFALLPRTIRANVPTETQEPPMATNRVYRIAVIPGDGIGKEVMPEGVRVLEAAARSSASSCEFDHFDFACCDYYAKHGKMMPDDWKEQIGEHDAIFFGAVGWPATVPDHISLWGSLIPFRRGFDQYVNLRPVRLMPGVPVAARRPQARRHRLLRRAREHRGRILLGRRPHVRGHRRARSSMQETVFTPQRRRPHPEVRLRAARTTRRRST